MEHRGPLEWVRHSSAARHIRAFFSHIQPCDTEPSRKVCFTWKVSPNYMGGTSQARRGQVLLKPREVMRVDWTWTQVASGTCLPRF